MILLLLLTGSGHQEWIISPQSERQYVLIRQAYGGLLQGHRGLGRCHQRTPATPESR